MNERKLEIWWASLTIAQKERIARKILNKQNIVTKLINASVVLEVDYPNCSNVWNALTLEQKLHIYEHCTDEHGYLLSNWQEGRSFSY